MLRRALVTAALPILAIASAWGIVIGGSPAWGLVESRVDDAMHPEVKQAERDLDGAFEKILPRAVWVAAGLPAAPASEHGFVRFRFDRSSTRFCSQRWLSGPGGQEGVGHLGVEGTEGIRRRRAALLASDEPWTVVAQGPPDSRPEAVRSWHVVSFHVDENGVSSGVRARCFYDAIWMEVSLDRRVTPQQRTAFCAVIEAAFGRMGEVCSTGLAPYIERANAADRAGR